MFDKIYILRYKHIKIATIHVNDQQIVYLKKNRQYLLIKLTVQYR